jgi:indolepyruvate ferredoxin oxidoreductase beta subunit
MIKNILLIGVGGQGTILTSNILTAGLIELGYDVKMSEIHGMAQRGGSVITQIRFGEKIYSPSIAEGEADIIVSFEKAEALRALPFLKDGGIMITDMREIYPASVLTGEAAYPYNALEKIQRAGVNLKILKAAETAEKLGSVKAQNIFILGALIKMIELDDVNWEELVLRFVPEKVKMLNIAAFRAGFEAVS